MGLNVKVSYFSKRTLRSTSGSSSINLELEKEILEAVESHPNLRKEIRRTFDMANKRIKRLQTEEKVISPALASINGDKFLVANSNGDWEQLKKLYAEAVAFIRSPTSTLGGAREFTEHIKKEWKELEGRTATDWHWEHGVLPKLRDAMDELGEFTGIGTDWGSDIVAQELFSIVKSDVASMMEKDAVATENTMQQVVNDTAKEIVNDLNNALDNFEDMLSDFTFLS